MVVVLLVILLSILQLSLVDALRLSLNSDSSTSYSAVRLLVSVWVPEWGAVCGAWRGSALVEAARRVSSRVGVALTFVGGKGSVGLLPEAAF